MTEVAGVVSSGGLREPAVEGDVLLPHQRELAQLQRLRGRAFLRASEAAALADAHDALPPLATDEDSEVVRLLTRPLSSKLEIPEYYRYTCLHAYAWFLDRHPDDPVAGALVALDVTMRDLLAVERTAAPWVTGPTFPDGRIARLEEFIAALRDTVLNPVLLTRIGDLVDRGAATAEQARRSALLAECTRFPRSDRHEEQVFLRVVQACELLFFLVRHLALEVMAAAERFPAWATSRLAIAGECARHLNRVLHVLQTLTPEGFMSFREATGAASAVQSLNYHAMEITIYGYDPRKAAVFSSIEHLGGFNRAEVKNGRSLSSVLADADDTRLAKGWHELDRGLSKWRGAHYRFARTYLSADEAASGGTEGAPYVKRFVKKDACVAGPGSFADVDLINGFLYL
ncbi:hypothetical protein ABZ700_19415 [Streptomyces diastaticus]|uniref:hypothetical protein n=1 Tax=Streptomyces diastaticus TaxID=1956 RepID=UPI00340F273E